MQLFILGWSEFVFLDMWPFALGRMCHISCLNIVPTLLQDAATLVDMLRYDSGAVQVLAPSAETNGAGVEGWSAPVREFHLRRARASKGQATAFVLPPRSVMLVLKGELTLEINETGLLEMLLGPCVLH